MPKILFQEVLVKKKRDEIIHSKEEGRLTVESHIMAGNC